MPRAPDFVYQLDKGLNNAFSPLNHITNLVLNPCGASPYIYAETALPAVGKLVVALLDFGVDDILRGAIRPKNLRIGSHIRSRGKGRRRGGGIPEVGELLGTAFFPEELRDRKVSNGLKAMWLLDGVIQRGLYYLMIIDLAEDFFYNWSTAVMASSCDASNPSSIQICESVPNATFFSLANAWTSVPSGIVKSTIGTARSRNGSHSNGGKPFHYSTSMSGAPILENGGPLELRVIVDGQVRESDSGNMDDGNNGGSVTIPGISPSSTALYQYRTNGQAYVGMAYSVTSGVS